MSVADDIIYAMSGTSVYYSINHGLNWNNTNYPGINPMAFTVNNNILVVSPGLYYTKTFGSNWSQLYVPSFSFQPGPGALCLTDAYLFAGYIDSLYCLPAAIITSIKENESNNTAICIAPNPAVNSFIIKLKDNLVKGEMVQIKIIDLSGRLVYSKILKHENENNIEINSERFAKGLYILSVQTKEKNLAEKFIIE